MLIKHYFRFFPVLLILFSIFIQKVNSQVFTRVYDDQDSIESFIPWYFQFGQSIHSVAKVDVDSVLIQDSISGRELPRIGIKKGINYTTSDGTTHDFDSYKIWKFTLQSDSAKSMSIKFSNTNLPNKAVMYISSVRL